MPVDAVVTAANRSPLVTPEDLRAGVMLRVRVRIETSAHRLQIVHVLPQDLVPVHRHDAALPLALLGLPELPTNVLPSTAKLRIRPESKSLQVF